MLSPELRAYLGGVLVKDVVKIIEDYVVGQSRRIAKLMGVIESVSWGYSEKGVFEDEDFVGTIRIDSQKIYYRFNVVRCVDRCRNCGTVQSAAFYDLTSEAMICHVEYWDCGDICGDGALFVDEDAGTMRCKVGESSIKFEFFRNSKMQRKICDPELVGFLDKKLPREITDEVLKYVVKRRVRCEELDVKLKGWVPLRFWFSKNPDSLLPLVSIPFHETKIDVEFFCLGPST